MTPERDEATEKTNVSLIDPALYAADQTSATTSVIGFAAATLLISTAVGGITFTTSNKIEYVLQHGNLADGSDLANVTDADLVKDAFCPATVTNGIVRSLVAAHAAGDVQKLGYIGGKGYLSLKADFTGTHGTGTGISAVLCEEEPDFQGAA